MRDFFGETGTFSKTIVESDVYLFAGITGDFNSIHINKVAAQESMFHERVAHGMLVGSFISTVIGMYMPGPGSIYLEQTMKFLAPVKIGDTITATVRVTEVLNEAKGILKLQTVVTNQEGKTVIDGSATVKIVD